MSQHDRRHDPYPWTWEPAALLLLVLGGVMLLGLQLGRAVANWLTAGFWRLGSPVTWITAVPGLLHGDAAAGLHPSSHTVASPFVLAAAVAVIELTSLSLAVVLLRGASRRWSPGRPRGFASTSQVDDVLGRARLRHSAHLVRPDLHPGPVPRTLRWLDAHPFGVWRGGRR